VIERAGPRRGSREDRHAAALAWTSTVSLALNSTRLGGTEHDLPVVAALLATALAAPVAG
jgi:hypothetical protein